MKRLITLVSTQDKTPEQTAAEVMTNVKKYERAKVKAKTPPSSDK